MRFFCFSILLIQLFSLPALATPENKGPGDSGTHSENTGELPTKNPKEKETKPMTEAQRKKNRMTPEEIAKVMARKAAYRAKRREKIKNMTPAEREELREQHRKEKKRAWEKKTEKQKEEERKRRGAYYK